MIELRLLQIDSPDEDYVRVRGVPCRLEFREGREHDAVDSFGGIAWSPWQAVPVVRTTEVTT